MKHTWQIVTLLVVAGAVAAAAQRPTRAHTPAPRIADVAHPSTPAETRGAESAEHVKSFSGIAKKLNTTPTALEQAYAAALKDNPKLTRGQFVAANMLAHNLGAKNPAITTDAILAGLKSGKSIGQTLKSLGVTDKEAEEAERTADKDAKEAEKDSDKPPTKG
ncbi:MAG TPA: hypothetical protein VM716_05655 [Gemmatimonadales bacterium]|nr:hypothetical protein [Gemmatimonadales bacterium]